MRHQTNIVGEWRVGDIIIQCESILFIIHSFHKDGNRVYVTEPNERGIESIFLSEKEHYINVSEMKRALGRA